MQVIPAPVQVGFRAASPCFATDAVRVNFLVGLLRGKALTWVQSVSTRTRLENLTYNELEENFKSVFDHPKHARTEC